MNELPESGFGARAMDTGTVGGLVVNSVLAHRSSVGRIQEVFHREGLSLTVDRVDCTAVAVSQVEKAGDSKKFRWIYAGNGDRYDVIAK